MTTLIEGRAISPTPDSEDIKLENMIRYRRTPGGFWNWACENAFTLDQASKQIRAWPSHLDYLRYCCETIIEEPLVALPKHRRMVITWGAICGISTWEILFHEVTTIAIVSKKEEDSDELVQRCDFIYKHIPRDKNKNPINVPMLPLLEYKYTKLNCAELDSYIKGYPQGADQMRQFGFSRIFIDEAAFHPKLKESFVGAKPTLTGGGKLCMVSTRYPGFFKNVVEDTIDDA